LSRVVAGATAFNWNAKGDGKAVNASFMFPPNRDYLKRGLAAVCVIEALEHGG
jgi:hypothetical protein